MLPCDMVLKYSPQHRLPPPDMVLKSSPSPHLPPPEVQVIPPLQTGNITAFILFSSRVLCPRHPPFPCYAFTLFFHLLRFSIVLSVSFVRCPFHRVFFVTCSPQACIFLVFAFLLSSSISPLLFFLSFLLCNIRHFTACSVYLFFLARSP